MKLQMILDESRAEQAKEDEEFLRSCALLRKYGSETAYEKAQKLAWGCVPCERGTYERWLRGYLEDGGKPTHVYSFPYEINQNQWFYAFRDFELPILHGAHSINLVVPIGVQVSGDPGHSKLFWMQGFKCSGFVPIYSDIHF